MKFKSLVSGVLLVALTAISFSSGAFAASSQSTYEGVAYNKVDLSQLGGLDAIKLSKEDGTLHISFELNDKKYEIDAVNFGEDENGAKYASTENADGVIFNILESKDTLTGVMTNKKISPINQTVEDSIGFVISKTTNQEELGHVIQQAQTENQVLLESSKQSIHTLPSAELSLNAVRPMASNLHVLASGTSIPFLLSSGVSEGWAYSRHTTQQYFRVSDLQYSIAYNWPSDGVSLWYDYINSVQAYHSPAWPSAGLTNVGGEWDIDATKGKLVAETTVTALVKNVPVGYSVYDTIDVGV